MRSMCHVELVEEIKPIENADNLEHYRIEGWWVVDRKGKYSVGEKICYIEIDGICPRVPYFDFLDRNGSGSEKNWRIRSVKLRQAISQGLIIPYADRCVIFQQLVQKKNDVLVPIERLGISKRECAVGDDLTEMLQIGKYEPFVSCGIAGQQKGTFPSWLRKTDEPRIQCKEGRKLHGELTGKPYYITVKMDGTSGTYYFNSDEFGVCSRNNEYRYDSTKPNVYWYAAKKHEVEEWLRVVTAALGKYLYIQGEVCGPKIQENKLKLLEPTLFVFNMTEIDSGRRLGWDEMNSLLGLYPAKFTLVPLLDAGESFNYSIDQLHEMSDGYYDSGSRREGIVVRHADNLGSNLIHGEPLSFKVISNKFLLKEK